LSERYASAEPHENAKSVKTESIDWQAVRKSVAHPNCRINSDCQLRYALLSAGYTARNFVFKIQICLTAVGRSRAFQIATNLPFVRVSF
jgi:hypothetical protein